MSGADTIDNGDAGAWAGGWKVRTAGGIIVLAALVAYWNSFDGAFVLDDHQAIRNNRHIRTLWPLSEAISLPMWDTAPVVVGRPVLSLSFAVNYALLGPDPWGYHLVNLAIHLAAALLLFGILRRTLQRGPLLGRYGRQATWLALAAALIWVVHPLQTESVTYLAQRAESLMGLFFLLTLYCAVRGFHARQRAWRWYALAITACWLGQGTKEVIAVAPLVVLLYDWLFVSGSLRASLRRRRGLYAGLAATWVIAAGLFVSAAASLKTSFIPTAMPHYALTQPEAILRYLRLAFWPDKLVLAYDWPAAGALWQNALAGSAVLVLLAVTAWGLWRRRALAFLGAWFFLILAPSSSFIVLRQRMQEHRMYLPLAAVVVLAIVWAEDVLRRLISSGRIARPIARVLAVGLVVAAVAGLGHRTVRRNSDYHSELALWSANVRDCPKSGVGHFNLGDALMSLGRPAEAVEPWKYTLACFNWDHMPTVLRWQVHNNLGNCYVLLGRTNIALQHLAEAKSEAVDDNARAVVYRSLWLAQMQARNLDKAAEYARKAVALAPDDAGAHSNLGLVLEQQGKLAEAIRQYRTAVSKEPDWATGHSHLGLALQRAGRTDEAIRELQKAVSIEPGDGVFHNNLGVAFLRQGKNLQAISCFRTAVSLKGDYSKAHANLGLAVSRMGKFREAVRHYERAVALDARNLRATADLAWLLATCPPDDVRNGRRAVELARRACAPSRYSDPMSLSVLAAAQAEVGNFDSAVITQRRAIGLLEPTRIAELDAFRRRLGLYRARRPCREGRLLP